MTTVNSVTPKRNSVPPLLSFSAWQPLICFCRHKSHYSGLFHLIQIESCNRIFCGHMCYALPLSLGMMFSAIVEHISVTHSLLLLSNIPLYRYTTIWVCLKKLSHHSQWVQKKWCPLFWLFWMMLLWEFGFESLCGPMFSCISGTRCGIPRSYSNSTFNLLRSCFPKLSCSQQSARLFSKQFFRLSPPAGYDGSNFSTY